MPPLRSRGAKTYVYREKNRTVMDVFNQSISGGLEQALETVAKKVVDFDRRHHTYKNRTGALETSVNYEKPVREGTWFKTVVFAGGRSSAKYTFDYALRRDRGRRRRNRLYPQGSRDVVDIRRGSYVWVFYAGYVRDKGYPVLKQGIDHYRRQIAAVLGRGMRLRRIR